ncbi:DUF1844 domain-containing protein [Fontivita pretiosa]|uniref:DUF1844 domain-containing protein n=1 Tax=Fontivita pretiosa TaxID=2989684 RepID=UPI003D16E0EE
MAEENPSLQIDTDWKKQAQEEKRRLAEEQKRREQEQQRQQAYTAGVGDMGAGPQAAAAGVQAGRGRAEIPPASFATLVHSLMTQALLYLGDLAPRGGEPVVNLDMAKHYIDTLAVLEEKTANNLTPDEKRLLDTALYETRMRYVSVASQFIS